MQYLAIYLIGAILAPIISMFLNLRFPDDKPEEESSVTIHFILVSLFWPVMLMIEYLRVLAYIFVRKHNAKLK